MSADFWAGYISGAIGILVGNPLDIVKTTLQAGSARRVTEVTVDSSSQAPKPSYQRWTAFARGAAAPIVGYGALNAILFVTYNRSLSLIETGSFRTPVSEFPSQPSWYSIWAAGALGGLATFFVSTPTELIKCRAQVSSPPKSSLQVAQELWRAGGLRGLYMGGGITAVRDAVGYGFYFWSYELAKRTWMQEEDTQSQQAMKVLLCGGLAGVVTWASIFPMDVIKTRVQTWDQAHSSTNGVSARDPLLPAAGMRDVVTKRPSTFSIAQQAYRKEGLAVFFRGLGICSARAFIVNAVQWAVYEWTMKLLT